MQISPEDLNSIEERRYRVADVSRFFGVPLRPEAPLAPKDAPAGATTTQEEDDAEA